MKNRTLNIENLTQLWKTVAKPYDAHTIESDYEFITIQELQWPNRIWNKKPLTHQVLEQIIKEMKRHSSMPFSHFVANNAPSELTNNNLTFKANQYGMSLPLHQKFSIEKEMETRRVDSKADAELWSSAFASAFGYKILPETIIKTKNEIPYSLLYHNNELVGTIILFITEEIAGIHSLGIIPAKRKHGYAQAAMKHILNQAIDLKATVATLQASEMARNMYLQLGFSQDFIMKNYVLK
ncbi:GNAT family N-acetyltransferase [Fulvivirga maritima]|uniref:GNAT family N-acetyltransferase n=1 Tax=Fulvivirga maritima TaxID=2904247 RepID=UPI001F25DC76|nr:GNAT family N-acetyltransferase [Fulvivirga maritima]UII26722.1 GNAT family N-acetyltransferase [Fulvivirga maritima]